MDEARAARDEAIADYRGSVLKALEDAETSLSRYGYQRRNLAGLERIYATATRAASLARQRYDGGTIALTDALDAERQRFDAEQNLAQGRSEMTEDFVALQKSLGLGWQPQVSTQSAATTE